MALVPHVFFSLRRMTSRSMKTLCVVQHLESEYLGLMEDHFEGRNIRFRYCRPFTPERPIPSTAEDSDGLVLLGAGPIGIVSGDLIPSLGAGIAADPGLSRSRIAGHRHRYRRLHTQHGGRWRGGGGAAALYRRQRPARRARRAQRAFAANVSRSLFICATVRFLPATRTFLAIDFARQPVLFQSATIASASPAIRESSRP